MDKLAKPHHEIARDTRSIDRSDDLAIPQPGFKQSTIQKLTSAKLFAGAKELVIAHAGQEYRLRETSQGKLILTK